MTDNLHKTAEAGGIGSLLALSHAYAAARGVSLSRVSTLCFNDGGKLKALEAGADIGARRLARALDWFSENWPEGAVWPEAVARPATTTINTGIPQVWGGQG